MKANMETAVTKRSGEIRKYVSYIVHPKRGADADEAKIYRLNGYGKREIALSSVELKTYHMYCFLKKN